MTLTSSHVNESDSRTLAVTARNPVAFLDTVTPLASVDLSSNCRLDGYAYGGGPLPLAFNSDGTRNTCSNPAAARKRHRGIEIVLPRVPGLFHLDR